MFKMLVLQALYSLSDEGLEFQVKDRLSFQRFLGLGLDGRVPDATTLWLFRERLVKARAIDKLFQRFEAVLAAKGYLAMGGQILDATIVPAPIRSAVEHVFAGHKHRMGLFIRTIGMARARIKIGMANLVYNFQRLAWLDRRRVPA